ncbi:MAG: T9SS type A sorting domain-containing protein [Bacteroidota bacterium]
MKKYRGFKNRQLKFILLLVISFYKTAAAQTFFEDKTNIYSFVSMASVSQCCNYISYLFRDSMHLDSIGVNDDEYYTVYQKAYMNEMDSVYHLKVAGKRVYYSGYFDIGSYAMDQLIYDFNYQVGDTFTLEAEIKYKFKVDSIKNLLYLDNKTRATVYYTVNGQPMVAAEGIGSMKRLLYFKKFNLPVKDFPNSNKVIAVCKASDTLVYFDGRLMREKDTIYQPTCDKKTLYRYVDHASADLNSIGGNRFMLYPNPANDLIHVQLIKPVIGKVYLYNQLGQLLLQFDLENQESFDIPLEGIRSKLIFIKIESNEINGSKTIIKVN